VLPTTTDYLRLVRPVKYKALKVQSKHKVLQTVKTDVISLRYFKRTQEQQCRARREAPETRVAQVAHDFCSVATAF